jgi:hypothetical protein
MLSREWTLNFVLFWWSRFAFDCSFFSNIVAHCNISSSETGSPTLRHRCVRQNEPFHIVEVIQLQLISNYDTLWSYCTCVSYMSVSSPQDRQQTTIHIRAASISFEGNPPCEPASELSYMSVKKTRGTIPNLTPHWFFSGFWVKTYCKSRNQAHWSLFLVVLRQNSQTIFFYFSLFFFWNHGQVLAFGLLYSIVDILPKNQQGVLKQLPRKRYATHGGRYSLPLWWCVWFLCR